ncbi:MAG: hypothetical protein NT056_07075 [Proteobacteria bacterium]|nr:hypothetical protein [Pseudomonadota bacterium]
MKRLKMNGIIPAALVLLIAFAVGSALMVKSAPAQEAQKSEVVQLNANFTLADNLTALKGKTVTVTISAGQSMSGTVKDVKNNLLHLEKLVGKEFYDALVVIEDISAVELRVRK